MQQKRVYTLITSYIEAQLQKKTEKDWGMSSETAMRAFIPPYSVSFAFLWLQYRERNAIASYVPLRNHNQRLSARGD